MLKPFSCVYCRCTETHCQICGHSQGSPLHKIRVKLVFSPQFFTYIYVCPWLLFHCCVWTCLDYFHSQRCSSNYITIIFMATANSKIIIFLQATAQFSCINCWVYAKGVKRVFIVNFAPTVGASWLVYAGWCVWAELQKSASLCRRWLVCA